VLAHYSKYAGTFKKFCQEFLSMVDTRNKLTTYKYNKYSIHCLVPEPTYILLCITPEKYQAALAFQYLADVFGQYKFELASDYNNYQSGIFVPFKFELNKILSPKIAQLSQRYSDPSMTHVKVDPPEEIANTTMFFQELNPSILRRHIKVPLLIQSLAMKAGKNSLKVKSNKNRRCNCLTRHPYAMLGVCIFLCIVILVYFVVIVPLCGSTLQKVDANGDRICWLPFGSTNVTTVHSDPPVHSL
jgi:hypothetical protein